MPDDRPPPSRRFLVGLAVFVIIGFVVRLVYILGWKQNPAPSCGFREPSQICGDALYYHGGANLLADGHGFVDVIRYLYLDGKLAAGADHPPLYSLYLAAWSLLGLRSVLAHQIASAVVGCASIVAIGFLGRRVAGERTGLLAAGGAAVYAALWVNDGLVMSESLAILMTAVMILQAYRTWEKPTLGNAAGLGAVAALGGLTRPELLLWLPVTALVLAFSVHPGWRERLRFLAVAALVATLVMAPWFARNAVAFRKPVVMSTNFGLTLAYTNCDATYHGSLVGYWYFPCAGPIPAGYDQSEADALYRRRGLSYARHHARRLPLVATARVARLWSVWEPKQMVNLDLIDNRERPLSWLILVEYWLLVPVAISGAVILRRRRVPLTPMMALVGTLTFTAAVTYGNGRFRATAEVVVVVLAAVAVDALLRRQMAGTGAAGHADDGTEREAHAPRGES